MTNQCTGLPPYTRPPYPTAPPPYQPNIGPSIFTNNNGQQQPSNTSAPPSPRPPTSPRPPNISPPQPPQRHSNISAAPSPRPPTRPIFTPQFGPYPVEMDCPQCRQRIVTETSKKVGILPWIIMVVCFIIGFLLFLIPWLFCWVPFVLNCCLDVEHSCPSCNKALGRYRRL